MNGHVEKPEESTTKAVSISPRAGLNRRETGSNVVGWHLLPGAAYVALKSGRYRYLKNT